MIEGIKPQALERIDDPEVYNFICWCLELADKRPTSNDLLEWDFLKDLDSEANNNTVRLKPKNKDKVRPSQNDTKTVEMGHTPVSHIHKETESPTTTMIPHVPESKQIDTLAKPAAK